MRKKFKILTSVLAVTLLFGTLLTGCGGEKAPTPVEPDSTIESVENNTSTDKATYTLNLMDYAEFYQIGVADGQASVRAYIETDDIVKVLTKHTIGWYDYETLERTLEGRDNHQIPLVDLVYAGDRDNFNYEVFALSNGDVLKYDVVVSERGLRLLQTQVPGVEFVWEDTVEYTVSGLESSIVEIDPFNDERCEFWLYFDGVSGKATLYDSDVVLSDRGSNGSAVYSIHFELDEMGHEGAWKNGDQIKISITESDEYLAEIGYKLIQREGIITIDWLPEN